jgi:putative Ca2+/H+ antiporter (TMEM165/GDT1 family)
MNISPMEWLSTASTAFGLIALAEMGDKTQLVCMTLAARYRGIPVLSGAVLAFAVLNLLAVLFGAAVAAWLPEVLIAAVVAGLFALFGIHALRHAEEEEQDIPEKTGHGAFLSALLLIFVAEFGDKTQLAVAGLASTAAALPVWLGATLGLALASLFGVVAGRTLLQRIPLRLLQRLSGILFLILAAVAIWRVAVIIWG